MPKRTPKRNPRPHPVPPDVAAFLVGWAEAPTDDEAPYDDAAAAPRAVTRIVKQCRQLCRAHGIAFDAPGVA